MNVKEAGHLFISRRKESIKRFIHQLFHTLTALTLALVLFCDVNAKVYAIVIFIFTSISFSTLFIFNIKHQEHPIANKNSSKTMYIASRASGLILFGSCFLLMLCAAHDYEPIRHVFYALGGMVISFLLLPPDVAVTDSE